MAAHKKTHPFLRIAIFLIAFVSILPCSFADDSDFWKSGFADSSSANSSSANSHTIELAHAGSNPDRDTVDSDALLSESEIEARREAEQQRQAARDLALIHAVAARDAMAVRQALTEGAHPDAAVPSPAPDELAEPHVQTPLYYYLKREKNFTALMFACALGDRTIVDLLLAAGANPIAKTERNRTLPIQLAAKAGDTYIQQRLLGIDEDHPAHQMSVEVDLPSQTVYVREGGNLIITAPISSGRDSHPTPTGTFVVTDRWRSWTSTIYNVKMPYFLRLSCSPIGLHAGRLPGYPASHGCIRLPHKDAKEIFQRVPIGTLVTVR